MSDSDDTGPEGFAFGMPVALPDELARAIVQNHERAHMRQDAAIMEIQNFLESLNVPQLLTLRRILCADQDSGPNQFVDGQIYQMIRLMHHADPDTGVSIDEQLGTAETGGSGKPPS